MHAQSIICNYRINFIPKFLKKKKIPSDLEIQTYHSIQVRGVNLIIVKKKIIMSNKDVALQADNIAKVVKY